MILYNVTVNIDAQVEHDWLSYMNTIHIPKVMQTGLFKEYKIYRLLLEPQEGGINYSVQYFAEDITKLEAYLEHHANSLIAAHNQRFKDKHAAFRTVLQEV